MVFGVDSYHGPADLLDAGRLVRAAYCHNPCWNGWSFARFDIWAQRRLGEERVQQQTDWQRQISFWRDSSGSLRGAAALDRRNLGILLSDPDCPDLLEPMLAWLEERCQESGESGRPFQVEALERNVCLNRLLAKRGFSLQADWMNIRRKDLDPTQLEPVNLPPGFSIKPVETSQDIQAHVHAVDRVFHMLDSEAMYRVVSQARSYRPELNLLVLNPAGETAAFATLWLDMGLSKAEFEPVGTLPEVRQSGLGLAVLAEGCNRLRALGCAAVGVDSWSESPGANRLYEKAGLLTQDRLLGWERK
jgi:ribosomal protein S18 acetylase RimI-like enzyme